MKGMFNQCFSLTILDLSSFNTEKVIEMNSMFNDCSSLTILNMSSFNVIEAGINFMFNGCANLSSCGSCDKKIVNEFNNK